MGQQQLLLLVLGIVIVGIAILVGINAYSENNVKTNWDALLQDGVRIGNDAQAWKGKPEIFGGSPDTLKSDPANFLFEVGGTVVDFLRLGYAEARVGDAANTCYENLNGVFRITGGATEFRVTGANEPHGNRVEIVVTGTNEAEINLDENETVKGGVDLDGNTVDITADATACT